MVLCLYVCISAAADRWGSGKSGRSQTGQTQEHDSESASSARPRQRHGPTPPLCWALGSKAVTMTGAVRILREPEDWGGAGTGETHRQPTLQNETSKEAQVLEAAQLDGWLGKNSALWASLVAQW